MNDTKTMVLKIGAMCGIPDQSCLISRKTRDQIGVSVGDVVRIEVLDGNLVARRVMKAPNVPCKDEYVFLCPEDIGLLNVDISTNVELRLDPEGIECP